MKNAAVLEDVKVHVKFKLAALWASVMFLYIYGDYFGLYQPGVLQHLLQGRIPAFGAVTQAILLAFSAMMAVPSVMVFLSLALPTQANRWVNFFTGALYTLIVAATLPGAWMFTIFLGAVEIALTLSIAWDAWRWPLAEQSAHRAAGQG
ncbi:MAG TPA: DUF6326 family protein [Candidatus Baltobacteraceae bacterium]|nr:DUF6326 family protein [Candidatus Baltobacteraceae bacterium]